MSLDVVRIDRLAWSWRGKLVGCRRGHARTQLPLPALFLDHDMPDGPLPHDRLELIRMATNREDPSRAAFVTLALVDYIEDLHALPIGERTAKLPYQLAWSWVGWTLNEHTGLPGGIHKARWPEVATRDIRTRPTPAAPRELDTLRGDLRREVLGRGGEPVRVPDGHEQLVMLGADGDALGRARSGALEAA